MFGRDGHDSLAWKYVIVGKYESLSAAAENVKTSLHFMLSSFLKPCSMKKPCISCDPKRSWRNLFLQ